MLTRNLEFIFVHHRKSWLLFMSFNTCMANMEIF